MRGDDLESYKTLVINNYPNPADKTNANDEELLRLIHTDLGDRPYPGSNVCHYTMNKVKYMSYRRSDGRRYKQTLDPGTGLDILRTPPSVKHVVITY